MLVKNRPIFRNRKMASAIRICLMLIVMTAVLTVHTVHIAPKTPAEPPEVPTSDLVPNPYDINSFGWKGDYMFCLDGQSVVGIDVSEWQGRINWTRVREAGVEFVMIRIGYRGLDKGELHADSWAQDYYAGAKAAGLKIGGYFFSQAINEAEALEEAEYALRLTEHWEFDLPIAFDWEITSSRDRGAGLDGDTLTACAVTFCERIRQAGIKPMVYFNWDYAHGLLNMEKLAKYEFWYALYQPRMELEYRVDMWQYTPYGRVDGINGDVDINLWLLYEEDQNE